MPSLVSYGHSAPALATATRSVALPSAAPLVWSVRAKVTGKVPSLEPAVTWTFVSALPEAATGSEPDAVSSVTPEGAVAFQSAVTALLPRLVSFSVPSPDAPGCRTRPSLVGPVAASTRSPPVVSDGGAADGSDAQEVSGCVPRVKSSVPAPVNCWYVSQEAFHSLPLTARDCTYGASGAACGALICTALPLARVTLATGNAGLPSTRVSAPGVSGYMPSSDQTYQELIAPRSSLPKEPTGALKYSFCWASRTAACVFHGSPV